MPLRTQTLLTLLYTFIMVVETTVLGNAVTFYTGIPRFVLFFFFYALILLVQREFIILALSVKQTFSLFILIFFVISTAFFDLSHTLRALKILLICFALLCCINAKELIGRFLFSGLVLSNIGLLLAILSFMLPPSFQFQPDFITDLRRYDEGFSGGFYWMQNFSGMFMIGDDAGPWLGGTLPRYSGYYPEPGINALYVLAGLAGAFYLGKTPSIPVLILTLINLLICFSVTGIIAIFSLFAYLALKTIPVTPRLLGLAFCILISISIFNFLISQDLFVSSKLQGQSLSGSIDHWKLLFSFDLSGSDSILLPQSGSVFALVPQIFGIFLILYLFAYTGFSVVFNTKSKKYDGGFLFLILSIFTLKNASIILGNYLFFIIILSSIMRDEKRIIHEKQNINYSR